MFDLDLDSIFDDEPPVEEEPPPKKRWTDLSTVFGKFDEKKTQRRRRKPDRSVQEMINVLKRNNRKEEAELMDENRGEIISWLEGIETVSEPSDLEKFLKKASNTRMLSKNFNPDNLPTWLKLSEVIYLAAHNTFEGDDYGKIDYKSTLRKCIAECVHETRWRRHVEMQKQKNQHDQLMEEEYRQQRQQRQQQLIAEADEKQREEEETISELNKLFEHLAIRRIQQERNSTLEEATKMYQEREREKEAMEREEEMNLQPAMASPPRNEFWPIEIPVIFDEAEVGSQSGSEKSVIGISSSEDEDFDEDFERDYKQVLEDENDGELETSDNSNYATTITPSNSAFVSTGSLDPTISRIGLSKASTNLHSNRCLPARATGLRSSESIRLQSDEISFTYDPETQELVADSLEETEETLDEALNDIISLDQDGYTFDETFENEVLNKFPEIRHSWCARMRKFQYLLKKNPTKSCLRKETRKSHANSSKNDRLQEKLNKKNQKKVAFEDPKYWRMRVYTPSHDFDRAATHRGTSSPNALLNAKDTGNYFWFETDFGNFRRQFPDLSSEVFSNRRYEILARHGGTSIGPSLIEMVHEDQGLITRNFYHIAVDFPYTRKYFEVQFIVDPAIRSKAFAIAPGNFMNQMMGCPDKIRGKLFSTQCFPRFNYFVHKNRTDNKSMKQLYGYAASHAIVTDSALSSLNSKMSNAVLFNYDGRSNSFQSWTRLLVEYNRKNDPVFPRHLVCCLGLDFINCMIERRMQCLEEEKKTDLYSSRYQMSKINKRIDWRQSNIKQASSILNHGKITQSGDCRGIEKNDLNGQLLNALICRKMKKAKLELKLKEQNRDPVHVKIDTYAARVFQFACIAGHILKNEVKLALAKGIDPGIKEKDVKVLIMMLPENLEPIADYAKIYNARLRTLYHHNKKKRLIDTSFLKLVDWSSLSIPGELNESQEDEILLGHDANGSIDQMYQIFCDRIARYSHIKFMPNAVSYFEWKHLLEGDELSREILLKRPVLQKTFQWIDKQRIFPNLTTAKNDIHKIPETEPED